MAHLVLLTGLPGIGKTTIATALPRPFYQRIHFGALLRSVVERRTSKPLTHTQFRHDFSRLIDAGVLHGASVLARHEADLSSSEVCVLDSHAVTPTAVGLRVTPDDSKRRRLLRFKAIVHLGLAGCLRRVLANCGSEGRHALSEADAQVAEYLQLSTGVVYAASYDCPLLVVKADGNIEQTVRRVDAAIRSAVGWWSS